MHEIKQNETTRVRSRRSFPISIKKTNIKRTIKNTNHITRSERCIPIKLLYPINYWDYHGLGWGLGQGSFYMHEMTIPVTIGIIKR